MELIWLVPAAGFAAVLYALWLAWDVLRRDPGTGSGSAAGSGVPQLNHAGPSARLCRRRFSEIWN